MPVPQVVGVGLQLVLVHFRDHDRHGSFVFFEGREVDTIVLSELGLNFVQLSAALFVVICVFGVLVVEVVEGTEGEAADADDGAFLVVHNY